MPHLLISGQGFSTFFTKFLPFLIIFQNIERWRKLRNFEKSSNMAKNEEKPCSTHFSTDYCGVPEYLILGTRSVTCLYFNIFLEAAADSDLGGFIHLCVIVCGWDFFWWQKRIDTSRRLVFFSWIKYLYCVNVFVNWPTIFSATLQKFSRLIRYLT